MQERAGKAQLLAMAKIAISLWFLWTCTVQMATSINLPNIADLQTQICRGIPGLNEDQVDICISVPQSIPVLTQAEGVITSECVWQFRKEQWNCTGITSTILNEPTIKESREAAFVYALTAGVTVHQITTACSHGDMGTECSCDYSRNGITTVQGWKWGSCSDNVSYGILFAQNFLDAREFDNVSFNEQDEIAKAMINLHNNAVGRRVVTNKMKLACRCHGVSGSCSVKTCWRELPTIYEISDTLKSKYKQAIKVEAHFPRDGSPAFLHYYDHLSNEHIVPGNDELVYLKESDDYCSLQTNYTKNRYCIPEEASGSGYTLKQTAMAEYYPACESFCCSGDYTSKIIQVEQSCHCRFVWCCEVVCDTCTHNITESRCTG